ncbi:MAG: ATP-grasp domain-containing protein [Dehalococcoidales bacterium]|nr:ATP-grasp domain-containing protein [Dehalococcoidales bacterium]
MLPKIAVIYNEPQPGRYRDAGEFKAELGVMEEVEAVGRALAELNYSAVYVPLLPPLDKVKKLLKSLDVRLAFNLFEGFNGSPRTEAIVADILNDLKFKFTGCPPSALALSLDKARTKDLLLAAGIQTPGYQILRAHTLSEFALSYPCIVKPAAEDASHGISEKSVVNNREELEEQVRKMWALFGGEVMVEEFIEGREFNTTVIGNSRLNITAVSEIVYTLPPGKPRILTFEAKWEEDSIYFKHTEAICPARIKVKEKREISRIAAAAFKLTGCKGYARVDLRQDLLGDYYVLEVNPNPDISPGSGAALQAATAGMDYTRFINRIVELARKRKK